jgi:undecaprenyl diphosphate synthase
MMKAVQLHSDPLPPPVHIAIIMDGNGRWAKFRGLPRVTGHKQGAKAVKETIKCAAEMGVSYLTMYGFSSENWKRPKDEVNDLMGLLRYYLGSEIDYLNENGIRFRIIGERDRLDHDIVKLIDKAEKLTAGNDRLTLTVALSYGGRTEIVRAARRLAGEVRSGSLNPEEINETVFKERLFTADIPDPDLLIRTSGEKRISNFLLWQMAYTELIFVDTLWPDFSKEDFTNAVREYHRRERRYGTSSG